MVCTTPVFSAIKRHYPDARVIVVGNSVNAKLLAAHPDVDTYIVVRKEDLKSATVQLRAASVDYAVTSAPSFEGLALCFLSGAHEVVAPRVVGGWCPQETISYRFLRMFCTWTPFHFLGYAPREYLRLLEPAGILTEDTTKKLVHTSDAEQRVRSWMEHEHLTAHCRLVGLTPSAGNKIKEWPSDRWGIVAERLAEMGGIEVVIIGSAADKQLVDAMRSTLHTEEHIHEFVGFPLEELKALISHLDLFVACDTGPIYIAEAYGIPTVDIVGPVDERVQPPRGLRNLVVVPERERAEVFIMNARIYNHNEARRQVESITPDDVVGSVMKLLGGLNRSVT
jgi:heptosyltransferase-2